MHEQEAAQRYVSACLRALMAALAASPNPVLEDWTLRPNGLTILGVRSSERDGTCFLELLLGTFDGKEGVFSRPFTTIESAASQPRDARSIQDVADGFLEDALNLTRDQVIGGSK